MSTKVDAKSNTVVVVLDEAVVPRAVGLAAACRFFDRCWVLVDRRPRRRLRIRLKGKGNPGSSWLKALAVEFDEELRHQLIRHRLSARIEPLRASIVGRALLADDATPGLAPADPVRGAR